METLLAILVLLTSAVSIIGWLWITAVAFSEGETLWGVGCLFLAPLCFVYAIFNFQELKIPFFMILGAFALRIAILAVTVGMG